MNRSDFSKYLILQRTIKIVASNPVSCLDTKLLSHHFFMAPALVPATCLMITTPTVAKIILNFTFAGIAW